VKAKIEINNTDFCENLLLLKERIDKIKIEIKGLRNKKTRKDII